MQETIIDSAKVRRELWILLACFCAAMGVNVGAILFYHTPWTEVFTMIGYVLVITMVLYVAQWAVRLVVRIVKKLTKH